VFGVTALLMYVPDKLYRFKRITMWSSALLENLVVAFVL
jgi:hypothetical protein